MDTIHDTEKFLNKTWFVYWKNNHHGPFSILELYAWTSQLQDTSDVYIWSEHQNDWALYNTSILKTEINTQESILSSLSTKTDLPILWRHWEIPDPSMEFSEEALNSLNQSRPTPTALNVSESEIAPPWPPRLPQGLQIKINPSLKKSSIQRTFFKIFILIITLLLITVVAQIQWTSWPKPPGMTEKDYLELSDQLNEYKFLNSHHQRTPKGTFAISLKSGVPLQFFIVSNIPDQSLITIKVQGVPSSLLGTFQFSKQITLKTNRKVTVTPPLNTTLPIGYYEIYLIFGTQTLAQKTYFFGSAPHETYKKELQLYHAHLESQARMELDELHEYTESLDLQAKETELYFDSYLNHQVSDTLQSTSVDAFHKKWRIYQHELQLQLESDSSYQNHNLHLLQNSRITLQEIANRISTVHDKQWNFAKAKLNPLMKNKPPLQSIQSNISYLDLRIEIADIHRKISNIKHHLLTLDQKTDNGIQIPWTEL